VSSITLKVATKGDKHEIHMHYRNSGTQIILAAIFNVITHKHILYYVAL
jgi:hypothetical protein